MKIAAWNVNSIKMRLEHALNWIAANDIDALLIQETKTVDELFPADAFDAAGFSSFFTGQKTYNGVAVVLKKSSFEEAQVLASNIPGYPDPQRRFLAVNAVDIGGRTLTLASAYFPNGTEPGCAKYFYKLDWIGALTAWVRERTSAGANLVLGGDFNIAPRDEDVWDPKGWEGKILVSAPERAAFEDLVAAGMYEPWLDQLHPERTYSWWDYRQQGFERNHGLRIDHILVSENLAKTVTDIYVDTAPRALEKPSDHAPVVAAIN